MGNAKFLDDMAKIASSSFSTFYGMKEEMEQMFKSQLAHYLDTMDMVPREEFDAVKAMLVKVREEQEALHKRLDALEGKPKAKPKKTTTKAKKK